MEQSAQQQDLPLLQHQAVAQQEGQQQQEWAPEQQDQAQLPDSLQTQPPQQQETADAAPQSVAAQQQDMLKQQQQMQSDQLDPQQTLQQLQEQMQINYAEQMQQADPYQQQQQQQTWYQLDARGKIDNYDEDDWFVPEVVPFKRRQNVSSTMAASRPHPWKRVRHHIAAENYSELPVDVPTYVSLEAPPPLYPPKRYCDITGR